jgi:hypothetical protein
MYTKVKEKNMMMKGAEMMARDMRIEDEMMRERLKRIKATREY